MTGRRALIPALAICLALPCVADAAIAPAHKGESRLGSFKAAFRNGAQAYKDRRVVAGPGIFRRAWTKAKAGVEQGIQNVKELGGQMKAGLLHARMVIRNAPDRLVSKVQDKLAARRAYKAAATDFKTWLKKPGNRDQRTFYRGARIDSGVNPDRVTRGAALFAGGTNVVATALGGGVLPAGLAAASFGVAHKLKVRIRAAERAARTRTIMMDPSKVSESRLAGWIRAGIVDPGLAGPAPPPVPAVQGNP